MGQIVVYIWMMWKSHSTSMLPFAKKKTSRAERNWANTIPEFMSISFLWSTCACTHTQSHTHVRVCHNKKATIPLPSIPISPCSQEGMVSSMPNMNKTSCYSFLDKHPPSARKQEGEKTPSFGFPPAIAMETGSPDTCRARQSGPTLYNVSALPEAQDGTSKHKQNLLNTLQGSFAVWTKHIIHSLCQFLMHMVLLIKSPGEIWAVVCSSEATGWLGGGKRIISSHHFAPDLTKGVGKVYISRKG